MDPLIIISAITVISLTCLLTPIILIYRRDIKELKKQAIERGHAKYATNKDGDIIFVWNDQKLSDEWSK